MFQGFVGDYGFYLIDHNHVNSVSHLQPDGKASQLGIQEGWVLEKIDNRVVVRMKAEKINHLLAKQSWPVRLTFIVTQKRDERYVPPSDIEMGGSNRH
jgi:hypothetical protein